MIDAALFVSDKIHEKQVTLSDGSVHTLHFKELPAVEFRKIHENDESSMANLVAASLVDPDGKSAITVKEANKLKPSAMNAIVSAIMEVNGFGAKNG